MVNISIRRKQRLANAVVQIPNAREALAFEQITLDVVDDTHTWYFKFGQKTLLCYWPAASRAELLVPYSKARPTHVPFTCSSVAVATRIAINAKLELLKDVQDVLRTKVKKAPKTDG